jgi:TPR repeat protein
VARTDESNRTANKDQSSAAPRSEPPAGGDETSARAGLRGGGAKAPKFGDIERRAAELAARLGGAGLPTAAAATTTSAMPSAPRSKPALRPLPEWPAVDEPVPARAERPGKGTADAPRKPLHVAAVIHEEDRDMDQLERLQLPPELDMRRWQRDSERDIGSDGHREASGEAAADADAETGQRRAAGDDAAALDEAADEPREPEAAEATAEVAPALTEPDMALALQDISQFIARQLQAQGVTPAAVGEPAAASLTHDRSEPDAPLIEEAVADRKTQSNLREIERQIRALSAAMSEDTPADRDDDELGATWLRADDATPSPAEAFLQRSDVPRGHDAVSAVGGEDAAGEADIAPETALLSGLLVDDDAASGAVAAVEVETAEAVAEEIGDEDIDATWSSDDQPDEITSATLRMLADDAPEFDEPLASDAPAASTSAVAAAAAAGPRPNPEPDPLLAKRVDSLEAQILGLLDRVTDNERRLGETLLRESREETRKSLDEAIASSQVFSSLRQEMGRLVDTREDYESRTSDSLDALHDALKDLSERLSQIEQSGRAVASHAEDLSRPMGGIASSVLTSRFSDGSAGPRAVTVDPAVPSVIALPADDQLPVWLDDGSGAGSAGSHSYETQADVFQSPADAPAVQPATAAPPETARQAAPAARPAAAPSQERRRETVAASPASRAGSAHEAAADADEDDGSLPYLPAAPQKRTDKDGDYLKAVRASVAERSAQLVEEETAGQGRAHGRGPAAGSLIDAARRRDQEARREHDKVSVRGGTPRPEKEGGRFNMLFIATTLVLFVTSAMLLYGMGRADKSGGSTSQVNAVEDKSVRTPLVPTPADAVKPAPEAAGAETKPVEGADKRSELGTGGAGIGSVALAGGGTSHDVIVTSSLQERDRVKSAAEVLSASAVAIGSGTPAPHAAAAIAAPTEPAPGLPLEIAPVSVRTAALKDDARAQHEIARNYEKGAGVAADPVKAMYWYRRSAHLGYAPSIYRMALAYERGNGVAKSYDKALELYLAAADKGNINAMHNLGVLYSEGELGKPDYPEAVRWYAKAADYGVKDSQVNLAIIYQNGLGVKKDTEEAYKWFFIASQNGDAEAKQIVEDMQADLSIQQRIAIEGKARSWKASTVSVEANFLPVSIKTYGSVRVVQPSAE